MLLDYLDLFPSCLPWFLRATCLLCPTRPLSCTQHANCSSPCSNSQPMSRAYTFRGLLADWSHYLAQSHRFLTSHPPRSSPPTFIFRFNRHDKGPESYSVRLIRACTLSKTLIPHPRSRMHALAPTPTRHQQAAFTLLSRAQPKTYLLSAHPFSALILNQFRHQIPRFCLNPRKDFLPCLTGELQECHFAPVGEMFGFLQDHRS